MESTILVDLLRVGLHGFALALAFLGYNLLKKITVETTDNKIALEKHKASLNSVHFFLVISLVFFFGGAILHIVDKKVDIEKSYKLDLSLVPMNFPKDVMPSISNRNEQVILEKNGTASLEINGKSYLLINAEKMATKIKDLSKITNVLLSTAGSIDENFANNEGGL